MPDSRHAREPLVIAVAQPECISHDLSANAEIHARAVRSAAARLVIFPELSLTGYELDAAPITPDDWRLHPIIEACRATGSVALAGAPTRDSEGRDHIGMLAIGGQGVRIVYRKMWLGGPEPERFSPGGQPAAIEIDGWRLGLAICKDTGVPQHAAGTAAQGMDAYVAGVCETAGAEAGLDARARRIAADHGVWVAFASFAGSTGGGFDPAAGHSAVWGRDGVKVVEAGGDPGQLVVAALA